MMSTAWDSLLQYVGIRYSKLAGIDGLLVVGMVNHDDVMTWRRFPRYWPCVRGIYRSTVVDSPHKKLVIRGFDAALMFAWTWSWANNQVAVDLRRRYAARNCPFVAIFRSFLDVVCTHWGI